MKYITDIAPEELQGKRVLLRTSLNLPIAADGSVEDIFRLTRGLPTIEFLVQAGARVIIVGYLGRKGDSMKPVADALMLQAPHIPMHFFGTPYAMAPDQIALLKNGECLILESTRREEGEENNDPAFIQQLASFADIFVGDAFAEAHRDYASNVGVAKLLPHYAGILMREEIEQLNRALIPVSPSLMILGGAKFETKEPLIRKLLDVYDNFLIAGALANDIFKAHGFAVGKSLVSEMVPEESVLNHEHLLIPKDITVEGINKQARVTTPIDVHDTDIIADIGPDTVAMLAPIIENAKSILWNGPTGIYEQGYTHYTTAIAELISKSTARAVIGGGDTVATIEKSGAPIGNNIFLSTGGGAMLEFLIKGTLPGIQALE
ncbi:MAG: Phosphoglycerate kinase [Candidatus Kaiserbacteria bacterium]|nr:Phosphoglycerate kinase [Candidatus Kaiserbacteria bacterium]